MTFEELEAKYPIGTKIRLVNDAQKMKDHAKKLGWIWTNGKEKIAGSEVVVIRQDMRINGFPLLSVKHKIHQSLATDGLWSIHLDWIVEIVQDKSDDPDQLLKQQRDNMLASIFGGG